MNLPDWVADSLRPRVQGGTALTVMVMLFRHGSPQVGPGGERRVYWSGQLGALTGASRGALDPAVKQLTALGALRVHEVLRAGSPRGYSAPVDEPSWGVVPAEHGVSEKSTPREPTVSEKDTPREFRAHANGGGGEYLSSSRSPLGVSSDQDLHHHHSPGIPREAVLSTLAAMDFNGAAGFVATYGPERVGGALLELWGEFAGGEDVKNPAGWLRKAVTDRGRFFEQVTQWGFLDALQAELSKTPELRAWEQQKARYIGGKV